MDQGEGSPQKSIVDRTAEDPPKKTILHLRRFLNGLHDEKHAWEVAVATLENILHDIVAKKNVAPIGGGLKIKTASENIIGIFSGVHQYIKRMYPRRSASTISMLNNDIGKVTSEVNGLKESANKIRDDILQHCTSCKTSSSHSSNSSGSPRGIDPARQSPPPPPPRPPPPPPRPPMKTVSKNAKKASTGTRPPVVNARAQLMKEIQWAAEKRRKQMPTHDDNQSLIVDDDAQNVARRQQKARKYGGLSSLEKPSLIIKVNDIRNSLELNLRSLKKLQDISIPNPSQTSRMEELKELIATGRTRLRLGLELLNEKSKSNAASIISSIKDPGFTFVPTNSTSGGRRRSGNGRRPTEYLKI